MKAVSSGIIILVIYGCLCYSSTNELTRQWFNETKIALDYAKFSSLSRSKHTKFLDILKANAFRAQVINFVDTVRYFRKKDPIYVFEKHDPGRNFYTVKVCQKKIEYCYSSSFLKSGNIFDTYSSVPSRPLLLEISRILNQPNIELEKIKTLDSLAVNFTIVSEINISNQTAKILEVLFY